MPNSLPYIKTQIKGGLGNKLFELAFLLGKSYNLNGDQVAIPLYDSRFYEKPHHETMDWSYFRRGIKEDTLINPNVKISYGPPCKYENHYLPQTNDQVVLYDGYFQSEKYFKHVSPLIRSQFKCPSEIKELILNNYPKLQESTFIHIRRGDNVGHPYHYFDLDSFWKRSIKELKNKGVKNWIICSDGIEWCKNYDMIKELILDSDSVTFVEEDEITTLWIMSLCGKGGIGSNSSFSWWGMWLNESDDCYFPDKLFTDYSVDISDYFPQKFKVLVIN